MQHKENIHDVSKTRRLLIADSDIGAIKNRPEGSVSESELREVLRRYNVRDGLFLLGKVSNFVFNTNDENKISKAGYREPTTGIFVTQFALAYIANLLIVSGGNDYKAKQISNKENLLTLCNIYGNSIEFPEIKTKDSDEPFTMDDFVSSIVRMYGEQFEFQFNSVLLVSRTILIFNEISNKVIPKKFNLLADIFKEKTGLSLKEYFYIAMAVWAGGNDRVAFNKDFLTKANIPALKEYFSEEKISLFLNLFSVTYSEFRKEDEKMNQNLHPIYTKFRFNPLQVFPIIKTDKEDNSPYIMPNTVCYVKRAYGGLYWWFHRYFEEKGSQQDFRNYFGEIFEEYVGKILKEMYGESSVHPEITYLTGKSTRKFIDWWVEKNGKIYLFESKAYQFALNTKQTGDLELLIKEVKSKIAKSIKQVTERIADIDKYEELKMFRGKTIIPVIVFMEIPLASGNIYKDIIKKELENIEDEKGITGLKDAKINFINIEELELYADVVDKIDIEDVFAKFENDMSEGFLSVIQKVKGVPPINPFLYKLYDNFWREMIGQNRPDSDYNPFNEVDNSI